MLSLAKKLVKESYTILLRLIKKKFPAYQSEEERMLSNKNSDSL